MIISGYACMCFHPLPSLFKTEEGSTCQFNEPWHEKVRSVVAVSFQAIRFTGSTTECIALVAIAGIARRSVILACGYRVE